jgi:hypothetical protein
VHIEEYESSVIEAQLLFEEKNAQYGDAVEETGVLGACVELVGTVARLKELVVWNKTFPYEVDLDKLADILLDIINYGAIAHVMLTKENWRGQEAPF